MNRNRSPKKKAKKLVSFQEMRQMQKQQETAHVGPGSTEYQKPFGSDLNKVDFGRKYQFKPDSNPPPGQYDPQDSAIKPNSVNQAFGKMKGNMDGRLGKGSFIDHPTNGNPSSGNYEPNKPFGQEKNQKMTLGGKYIFKPDKNPPPGMYDPSDSMVRPKTANQVFGKSKANMDGRSGKGSFLYSPTRDNPSGGNYSNHIVPFGQEKKQKMTLGGKYIFKPDKNPPPGLYDPSDAIVRPQTAGQAFGRSKANMDGRAGKGSFLDSPTKSNPSGGQYNHIKPFGTEKKQSMTLGGKYIFKPDNNPPPGSYDPQDRFTKPKNSANQAFGKSKANMDGRLGKGSHLDAPSNSNPSAGNYEPKQVLGKSGNKMTLGGKYKSKYNNNPPPGSYEADKSMEYTKPRIKSAVMSAPKWYAI